MMNNSLVQAASTKFSALNATHGPLVQYRQDLLRTNFHYDKDQEKAVLVLQEVFERIVTYEKQSISLFERVKRKLLRAKPSPIKGLYMWGGVGRGKTYLMDIFYESLPMPNKLRTHFHRFMHDVHKQLKSVEGTINPLDKVAQTIASRAKVICFDEFFVTDITDAMILAKLLKALLERGCVLITTSNIVPSGLYANGLQRALFLPAIDLLNLHTYVMNVDGGIDYRLRVLEQAELYYIIPQKEQLNNSNRDLGLQPQAEAMKDCFERLLNVAEHVDQAKAIQIQGRSINTIKVSEHIVWFDFYALCDGPRSQNDYLQIAKEYATVFIQSIPVFDGTNDDQARRFVYVIDVFYDHNVKLVLGAEASVDSLYRGTQLEFEFERTQSRIIEMQSKEYLGQMHI